MATTAEKIIKTAPVYNVTPNPQTSSLSPIELTRIRLKIRGLAVSAYAAHRKFEHAIIPSTKC